MRSSRLPIAAAILAMALLAGCGSDGGETTQLQRPERTQTPLGPNALTCKTDVAGLDVVIVSGVSCEAGRDVALAWTRAASCSPPGGASRSACTVASFRCLATAAGRGTSVSCSARGRSISFLVKA